MPLNACTMHHLHLMMLVGHLPSWWWWWFCWLYKSWLELLLMVTGLSQSGSFLNFLMINYIDVKCPDHHTNSFWACEIPTKNLPRVFSENLHGWSKLTKLRGSWFHFNDWLVVRFQENWIFWSQYFCDALNI